MKLVALLAATAPLRGEASTARVDEPTNTAAEIKALKQQLAEVERRNAELATQFEELKAAVSQWQAGDRTAETSHESSQRASVDARGGPAVAHRRLTSGASYVAANSLQLHEFPSGHSCSMPDEYKTLLAVEGSSPTWEPSPLNPTSEVSLVTVAENYALTIVQTMPAPLKVVHDSNCSNAPTITLQLDTNVVGSLSLNGVRLSTSMFRTLKCRGTSSAVAGRCAKLNTGNGNVEMADCNLDYNELQLSWYGEMIRSQRTDAGDGQCMLMQSDYNVVAANCNNADGNGNTQSAESMYFYFDGDLVKNRGATSRCLQCGVATSDTNTDVRMATCDGSDEQRWFWWEPGQP